MICDAQVLNLKMKYLKIINYLFQWITVRFELLYKKEKRYREVEEWRKSIKRNFYEEREGESTAEILK